MTRIIIIIYWLGRKIGKQREDWQLGKPNKRFHPRRLASKSEGIVVKGIRKDIEGLSEDIGEINKWHC